MEMFNNICSLYAIILLLFQRYWTAVDCKDVKGTAEIAIIGGGIGGTATAYFLKELLQDEVVLDLYEPGKIGGRLATSSNFAEEYEMGGSVIHPRHIYMANFIKKLGLEKNKKCEARFGIFDGEQYAFIDSSWEIVNIMKFLMRYGLDVYWLQKLNSGMLDNFSKIYKYQEEGIAFKTVRGLLSSMDSSFPSLVELSIEDYLKKQGLHDLIIKELVTSITRTNYGQSPAVHAFVGSLAVAEVDPGVFSVVGGNKRVPEELLKHSSASKIEKIVTKISAADGGRFRVFSVSGEGRNALHGNSKIPLYTSEEETFKDYDAVAIATPLNKEEALPRLVDFNESFEFPGSYERVVSTLVQGEINENTFRYNEAGTKVEEILTDNASLFYNFVGKQFPVNKNKGCSGKLPVFRVFSPERLTDEQLGLLFKSYNDTEVIDWRAFPHYLSQDSLDSFELVPGLFYNNGIEKAASAMEMSSIAAKNVALLIYKYLTGDEVFLTNKRVRDEF